MSLIRYSSILMPGPFQPSNEMKLGFYAHYKQATQGPCTQVAHGGLYSSSLYWQTWERSAVFIFRNALDTSTGN